MSYVKEDEKYCCTHALSGPWYVSFLFRCEINIRDIGRPETTFYHEKSTLLNTRKSGKNREYKARHSKISLIRKTKKSIKLRKR